MRYDPLTREYAKWLYAVVDRFDWGCRGRDGHRYVNESWLLEAFRQGVLGCYPQKLTMTTLQAHLKGYDHLSYTSSRGSGFCLACIDVDAHEGQTDAFEAACWIRDRFFQGAFLEGSHRGFHIYVWFRVGFIRRCRFNLLLSATEKHLGDLLALNGFTSKVEVLGGFTEWDGNRILSRGHLAPLPLLTNGLADLTWLTTMPVFLPSAAVEVERAADEEGDIFNSLMNLAEEPHPSTVPDDCLSRCHERPLRESPCAWERMTWACFEFTFTYRRLPAEVELLVYYQTRYGTDEGDHTRRRRARYAIRYRAKTFDPDLCFSAGGYETLKPKLFEAVRTHCHDRSAKYKAEITDEDLAIALYTFHVASFTRHERPQEQWTVGNGAIKGMFEALKRAGITTRGCRNVNKQVALKTILSRSGLVECFDSKYVPADGNGIAKKYTIGPSHWLYAQWVRWAESVPVKKVEQIVADRVARETSQVWPSCDEDTLLSVEDRRGRPMNSSDSSYSTSCQQCGTLLRCVCQFPADTIALCRKCFRWRIRVDLWTVNDRPLPTLRVRKRNPSPGEKGTPIPEPPSDAGATVALPPRDQEAS